MQHVELRAVEKKYGAMTAIRNLNLGIEKGTFCALLGPSGCGKSTVLRMIAGLEDVTRGEIHIDGIDVTNMPPAKRRIAMVFQSYALYPHMTVRQNIGFSLRVGKMAKDAIERQTLQVAQTLKLEELLDRRPAQLSGGQRQRVAIGRALVRAPTLFLFDEPLSNLDAMLRTQMRVEIARLHKELGTTMIYVTHDQVEAMTLADQIVILNAGEISQIGTPIELYERPANKFVASFIGSPTMNFLACEMCSAAGRDVVVTLADNRELKVTARHGVGDASSSLEIGIRPEHVDLIGPDDPGANQAGIVEILERLGSTTILYVNTSAGQIVVLAQGTPAARIGDSVGLVFNSSRVHLFAGGTAI